MTIDTQQIAANAMLVDVRISRWSARKLDKKAAAEVAVNNAVQSGSGRYYKSLIEGEALDNINRIADAARRYHYSMTLPWSDSGPRVLASAAYFDYMKAMQDYASDFDAAVNVLVQEYPLYRQEAVRLLGSLFRAEDYPDPQDIVHLFGLRVSITPLPTASDFRVDIGRIEADAVRDEIEKRTQETIRNAVADVYARIQKVLDAYVDRLGDPKNVFRDSLVENARELVSLLPSLNFTNDPHLSELAERMHKRLTSFEPDDLRKHASVRAIAHREATAISNDLNAFLSGAFSSAA